MATEEIKELLVDYFDDTTEKDWKRIAKKNYNGVEVRTFLNKQNNESFWVFGDADDECIHPADDHLYYLSMGEDPCGGEELAIMAAFNPVSYWKSDKALWDQHCGFMIETIYGIPSWIELDEVMENNFYITIPEDKTIDDVKAAFENCGLLFDQEFHDFMSSWK